MTERGKFIVIEGSDSSGKEVQSRKLAQRLQELNYSIRFLDFPRYDQFFGKEVGRYLTGEFGSVYEVSPWLSAYPFALDRFEIRDSIIKWLDNGDIIISNRYVGSNLGYMSAKLAEEDREGFIRWLEEFEYQRLGLPQEDISIFLHVPARVGQKLTYQKDEKVYMKGRGRGDIHEKDLKYLEASVYQFLWLTRNRKHWVMVDCMIDDENLKPPEEIHQEILNILVERDVIKRR